MSLPAFGLVVVGFESTAEWDGFFASIESSSLPPAAIVVVDNSPDLSLESDSWGALPVSVVHTPENLGYGRAANRGASALPPNLDWVVICNPDSRFHPGTMLNLLQKRDALPNIGVLGPQVLTTGGEVFPSARAIPGIRIGIGHAVLSKLWPKNPWTAAYLGTYEGEEPKSVGWLSGSFILVNRSAFSSIGGFDERYFMFFEDVDLGLRIKQSGHRNVYVPAARVTHSGAHSTLNHEKEMLLAHHKSAGLFLEKLYPRKTQRLLVATLRAGLQLRAWIQTRKLQ